MINMMNNYSIVALGSGQGSTIEFFCKKAILEKCPFKIKAVATENPRAGVLEVAKKFHLPGHIVEYKNKKFQDWDKELCELLLSYNPQLIILAGFLKKIGPAVLHQFQNKIINSHPSLLPVVSGHGMYGLKVHQAVIREKKSQTGVSIHVVNSGYDKGPILAQKTMPVRKGISAVDLETQVKKIEKIFYFEIVLKIIKGEVPLP